MNNKHNAILRGGPADGESLYVSAPVDFINLDRSGVTHQYAISDEHELVDDSMLLIWRHQGTVGD